MKETSAHGLDWHWFIPLFIGFWLGMSCLISCMGGWHALAKKYRATGNPSGRLFFFASMEIRHGFSPMGYRSCLFVRLNPAGIGLSVLPPFRFWHPRLFIPWAAISDCQRERFWFLRYTAVYVSQSPIRLLFRGKLGREIYEARSHTAGPDART